MVSRIPDVRATKNMCDQEYDWLGIEEQDLLIRLSMHDSADPTQNYTDISRISIQPREKDKNNLVITILKLTKTKSYK